MPKEFSQLEDYEAFIQAAIKPWHPSHRSALAAAMAERWFHAYQIFSSSESWGNSAILRQSLDEIWNTLEGQPTSVNWSSLSDQIHQNTPHMDDFDANEALCVCVMIQYAINCCKEKENHTSALMAVLSGLEAVQPDLLTRDKVPLRFWKQAVVHKEIEKQLSLIEKISIIKDAKNIRAELRPFLANAEILGVIKKRETKSGPVGLTNQQAFERYQKIIALDNKSAARGMDPQKHPEFATMLFFTAWMARYGRRKQIFTGEYGALLDQIAVNFQIKKNRSKDLAETRSMDWAEDARLMIDMCYQNKHNGLDADTPADPHGYGPSLRRLWIEAKHQNLSDRAAWEQIQTWARSEPATQKRSKHDKSGSNTLQNHLAQNISWDTTNNPEIPWQAKIDNKFLQVQLNDFPDEAMYSLLINQEVIGKFHNWPKTWTR